MPHHHHHHLLLPKRLVLESASIDLICAECSLEQLKTIRTELTGRDAAYLEVKVGLELIPILPSILRSVNPR